MKKLVILRAGRQVQEVELNKPVTTIGRQKGCDIWLDDAIVSRNHAQFVFTSDGVPYIEDRDSSNGMLYKGKRIKRVAMRNGEMVHIGAFMLRYESAEEGTLAAHKSFASKTQVFNAWESGSTKVPGAVIKYLSGAQAGNIFDLRKPYTAIGEPGKQGAVVTRREQGYFIRPLTERAHVTLDGKVITGAHQLKDKMKIVVEGVELEFHIVAVPGGA